jgi:hypothetical protein
MILVNVLVLLCITNRLKVIGRILSFRAKIGKGSLVDL